MEILSHNINALISCLPDDKKILKLTGGVFLGLSVIYIG